MHKKLTNLTCISIIILISSLIFTGCYDLMEVDSTDYALAVGVDKGKTNILKVTFQIVIPKNITGGQASSDGGGSQGEPSTMVSIEASTLCTAINLYNTYSSRKLNLTHCKALIISKELAKEGVSHILHSIVRTREFRPDMHVLVSRTSAEEFIKSIIPEIEINPAKYYELKFKSYEYTAFIPPTTFHDFYFDIESLHKQGVAILASINRFSEDTNFDLEGSTYKEKNRPQPYGGEFKAGDLTRKAKVKSEMLGTAVFDGDKMVGELDAEETVYYLMAVGKFNHTVWCFPDPKYPDQFVSLKIYQNRKPRTNVKLINGKPYIYLKLNLEADILSILSKEYYESSQRISLLETYIKNLIKEGMVRTLEKTARQYRSDIFGFGQKAKSLVLTWQQWEAINWKNTYQCSQFNVDVNFNIRRVGLITKSYPSISSQGKE